MRLTLLFAIIFAVLSVFSVEAVPILSRLQESVALQINAETGKTRAGSPITVTKFASVTGKGDAKEQKFDTKPGFASVLNSYKACMKSPIPTLGSGIRPQANYNAACLNHGLNAATYGRFSLYSTAKPSPVLRDSRGFVTGTTPAQVRNIIASRMGAAASASSMANLAGSNGIYVIYEGNNPRRIGLYQNSIGLDWSSKDKLNYKTFGFDMEFWKL